VARGPRRGRLVPVQPGTTTGTRTMTTSTENATATVIAVRVEIVDPVSASEKDRGWEISWEGSEGATESDLWYDQPNPNQGVLVGKWLQH
jgi:hypothetical protein